MLKWLDENKDAELPQINLEENKDFVEVEPEPETKKVFFLRKRLFSEF